MLHLWVLVEPYPISVTQTILF